MNPLPLFWQLVVHEIDKVSSLSTPEFIKLVGNYHSILSGKSTIDPNLKNRGYSAEVLAQVKNNAIEKFSGLQTAGLYFKRPPSEFKSDLLSYALILFENYERGVLPFPGSTSEQPAQIMEIFSVLQTLRFEQEEKQRKKIEKDVRRKGKSFG